MKRRDPLPETYISQLRIDLAEARPLIWRRIEIGSDVDLWTLHRVIQGTFNWFDAHLYRFSLGRPFSRQSELFLSEIEMRDGECEGTNAADIRLDETLQHSGDQLEYMYYYGDNWHLQIKLEKIRPALPDGPTAVCIDGQRAAPPEDSGGMVEAEFLAEFIEHPAFFDPDATNELIGSWLETPAGFAPAVALSNADSELHAQLQRFPQFRHILDCDKADFVHETIFLSFSVCACRPQ